jgi:hypothetical protein
MVTNFHLPQVLLSTTVKSLILVLSTLPSQVAVHTRFISLLILGNFSAEAHLLADFSVGFPFELDLLAVKALTFPTTGEKRTSVGREGCKNQDHNYHSVFNIERRFP